MSLGHYFRGSKSSQCCALVAITSDYFTTSRYFTFMLLLSHSPTSPTSHYFFSYSSDTSNPSSNIK